MLRVLLRKRWIESTCLLKKRAHKRLDVVGIVSSILLLALCIFVVVKVFGEFTQKYCQLRTDESADLVARQFEIMTVVYAIAMIVGIISSVFAIGRTIFDNKDITMFAVMPISPYAVFLSKIIELYVKQILTLLVIMIPINVTFAYYTQHGTAYVLWSIGVVFLMPVATLSIASLIALPFYIFKKWLSSRYVLLLVVATVFIGGVFFLYVRLLDEISVMLTSGELKYFFSQSTIVAVAKVCKYLYPANLLARITIGIDVLKNFAIFVALLVALGTMGYFVVYALFNRAYRLQQKGVRHVVKRNGASTRTSGIFATLLRKELLQILHTPSYAIQYFSVAVLMPFMVYACTKMGKYVIQALVFVNCDVEVALLITLIFSCLTNTFCATNVSREGKMLLTLKTMPIKPSQLLGSKILLSIAVALLADVVSVVTLWATGFLGFGQSALVLSVTVMHSVAQICFATRKDLSKFKPIEQGQRATESNATVSTIIVWGLCIAFLTGGLSLYASIVGGLKNTISHGAIYGVNIAVATLNLGLSLAYMLVGLRKTYDRVTEG